MSEKKKVVVGLSGGVDSSVAAYLLKEQGYDVIGVTMQIWQDDYSSDNEENISAINDAKAVAEKLEIPYYVLNFRDEFKENIISYFIDEYFKGRTPNPCTVCNRFIKWEALLKRCKELGADFVATGHYAGIDKLPNGRYSIKNSVTATKDQTYALYNLTQEQLAHTIMPLGNYTKDQVRAIAADLKLPIAAKPDSMDICFVPDGDYAGFIKEYSGKDAVPGNFVDTKGNILGQHNGIIHYTVGQRKGLGLSMGHPVFVVKVKPETNEVVIGENDDIFSRTLYADRINFMSIDNLTTEMRVTAKIRYNHKGAPCTIKMIDNDLIECTFDEPVRAITPGQAVVFYDSDYVVGGGTII
ncbi:MAG: tRNA 2-thiouridine(34) synthase MnmA [Lachnospiraceae bacterium]|nr:tRNA 2-thiouridine(34) synthase MnmA [Lachnospiraceae bacterium]